MQGNYPASRHRLLQFINQQQQQQDATTTGTGTDDKNNNYYKYYYQVALAKGLLGDICQKEGNLDEALKWYKAAVTEATASITTATGTSHTDKEEEEEEEEEEVGKCMETTYNKIGEVYHRQDNVAEAVTYYTRALELRQARVQHHINRSADNTIVAEAVADVVTSLFKLSHAHGVLGHKEREQEYKSEGIALIDRYCVESNEHIRPKFDRLRAYINAL